MSTSRDDIEQWLKDAHHKKAKAQASLYDSDGKTVLLIYNEDRSFEFQCDGPTVGLEVMKMMAGRPKVFFNAELIDLEPGTDLGKYLRVDGEAEWQQW